MKNIIKITSIILLISIISSANLFSQIDLTTMKQLTKEHLNNSLNKVSCYGIVITDSWAESERNFFCGTYVWSYSNSSSSFTQKFVAEYNIVFNEPTIINLCWYNSGRYNYTIKKDGKIAEFYRSKFY